MQTRVAVAIRGCTTNLEQYETEKYEPDVVLRYLRAAQMVAQMPPTARSVAMMPNMMFSMSTNKL